MTKVTVAVQPGDGQELVRVFHHDKDGVKADHGVDVGTNVTIDLEEGDSLSIAKDVESAANPVKKVEEGAAEKPLEKMNLEELKAAAAAEGIDLGAAGTKAQIVTAIKAEREVKAQAAANQAQSPTAESQGDGTQGEGSSAGGEAGGEQTQA